LTKQEWWRNDKERSSPLLVFFLVWVGIAPIEKKEEEGEGKKKGLGEEEKKKERKKKRE